MLLQVAEESELLVLGVRGAGAWEGLGLGSVSQAVLHHPPCTVAVIHSR
jgi:nucleotide-binding universal stress UspA family protein